MALSPKQELQFDEEALKARAEFEHHWQQWTVRDVAKWWNKWCRGGGTNHDRLGRILMDVTKVRPLRVSQVIRSRALTDAERKRLGL